MSEFTIVEPVETGLACGAKSDGPTGLRWRPATRRGELAESDHESVLAEPPASSARRTWASVGLDLIVVDLVQDGRSIAIARSVRGRQRQQECLLAVHHRVANVRQSQLL